MHASVAPCASRQIGQTEDSKVETGFLRSCEPPYWLAVGVKLNLVRDRSACTMAAGKHWTEAEGRRASVLLHLFKPSTLDALLSDLRLSRAGPSKGSSIDAALHIMELDGSLMNCLKRVATRGDLVNFLMIVLTESQLDNYKLSKIEQDDLLTAVMHYVMDVRSVCYILYTVNSTSQGEILFTCKLNLQGFTGGVSVFEDSVYAAQQQLEDADKVLPNQKTHMAQFDVSNYRDYGSRLQYRSTWLNALFSNK